MLRRIFFPGEQLLSPLAKNNDLVLLARGAVSIDTAGGVKVRNERPQSRKWGIWGMMRSDDERRSFFPLFRTVTIQVLHLLVFLCWSLLLRVVCRETWTPLFPHRASKTRQPFASGHVPSGISVFFVTGRTIRVERRGESLRGLSQREGMEMDMISPDDALHPAVASLQCTFCRLPLFFFVRVKVWVKTFQF